MCAAAGPFFLFLAYVAKSPMLFCELMPMAVGGFFDFDYESLETKII
jgi:hypothetical protein